MSGGLKAGVLGALIGVGVTVAWYEATAPDAPPTPSSDAPTRTAGVAPALDDPLDPPDPHPPAEPAPTAARDAAPPAAAAELATLRAELDDARETIDDLRAEIADERALRDETEGRPVPFPDALDDKFRGDALRQTFEAALAEADLEGEIVSVDCSEFPCIVYGDVVNDDEQALEHLGETDAMQTYAGAGNNTSAWSRRERDDDGETDPRLFFGVALLPEAAMKDEALRAEIGKRLRFRNQQAFDAFRPEIEDE